MEIGLTRSGRFLLLRSASHTTTETRFLSAGDPAGVWKILAAREPDVEYDVDEREGLFYVRTNDEGRNFRVVTAPAADPRRENWQEIVAHRESVMVEGVDCFARFLALSEREGGLPRIRVTELPSGRSRRIEFPEPAYDAFPTSNRDYGALHLRYNYQSFLTPSSVFDYDVASGESVLRKRTEVPGYDASLYRSERLEAAASDGAKIPISLVARKGVPLDGSAPMLLYGYGSYGLTVDVAFNSNRLCLLDRGVVFAVAHVRGGGELGKAWHDEGRMGKKMNTFTDLVAAAEDLIARGWTVARPARDRGRERRRAACWSGRQPPARSLPGRHRDGSVRRRHQHDARRIAAADRGRVRGMGKPERGERIPLHARVLSVRQRRGPKLSRDAPEFLAPRQPGPVLGAREARREAARDEDRRRRPAFTNEMAAGHGGPSGRYDRLREIAFDQAFLLSQWGVP